MKSIKLQILFILILCLIGCQGIVAKRPAVVQTVTEVQKKEKTPDPEGLRHFMDGQILMTQGDFAMAIIEFQQALDLDPNVGAIHTAIAECYWNLNKQKLSEKHLSIAINIDPKDEQALQMLADQHIFQKQYEAARVPLEKLNKLNPNESRYLIALAELQKVNQDFEGAMRLYLEAFTLEPDRLELLESAGQFAIFLKDEEKAITIFKQLAESDPSQPRFLSIYVDMVSRTKSYDEGIAFIASLNKKHGDLSERNNQLGLLLFRKGDKEEAMILLESAVETSPDNPNYYFSLFDIYMDENNIKKAAYLGDELIANFPEDWRGYYSRSLVYMNQNNSEAVIDLLAPVSDNFNEIFSIQYLLGLSNNRIKQYEEAEKYYLYALTIQPDSKNVLHSLAILYDEVDQFDKSDKIYLKLIKTDSSDAQAFNNYAYSLVERDTELNKALTLAKKAIELEPDNASYLDTIGWIYFKLNNMEKAQSFIEASVKIIDNNAIVLEHLGDILMKNNKYADAKDLYKRALALDKDNLRLKEKVSLE